MSKFGAKSALKTEIDNLDKIRFANGRGKYRAKPANGFPSKLESAVYELLKVREAAGEIRNISRQVSVELQPGDKDTRIRWRIDFSFERVSDGRLCYAEAKGIALAEYRLKLKLFKGQKLAPIEIWSGTWQRPKLIEKFEPELGVITCAI